MITVLIADDQPLIRSAVVSLLGVAEGITVVGEASDGREAVQFSRDLRPDVVVMDIRMPVLDGIRATAAICADAELASTRVLILTTFEEDEYVVDALRAGASGFLGKGAEPDEILSAVRAVNAGDALLSPTATRSLISRYILGTRSRPDAVPELQHLTARERQVLVLVASGLSNSEIAANLVISQHTAKTHVNRIMSKTSAHDRAQLVILAYEGGLLVPGAERSVAFD